MIRPYLLSMLLLCGSMEMAADNKPGKDSDPVVMTVNGKPITRSEFEYAYNKNGSIDGAVEKKTVQEYAQMFANYRLKVEAALANRLDTLSSFKKEFATYRDLQLYPYMVDSTFIDSVAHSMYDRTVKQLDGHDLLHPAHILIMVQQKASDADKDKAKAKIDSIYTLLSNEADFAEVAKKYSQDKGTAVNGGQLPWIGPKSVVKEFEDEAYKLKKGEISKPFLSSFGYHIIKMTDRKPLDSYATLRNDIIANLKRQGIDEASANHRIEKIVADSKGKKSREMVIDSVINAHIEENPQLKYLIEEYHDGLLSYEVTKRNVWDKAANDTLGLEAFYDQNKKKYAWTQPRFKGLVYQCASKDLAKKAKKVLKKEWNKEWKKAVRENFNKKGKKEALVSGPYLCKEGENAIIDQYVFKRGKAAENKKYPFAGVVGKKMSQPKSYEDVKSLVVNDYQEKLEKEWIEQLRTKYPVVVNEAALKTVNNH